MDVPTLRVLDIIDGTIVDGPGLRTSIYLAGCAHQCPGCHNPQSWNFEGGTPMTIEEIMARVRENDFDVTLTGGDPLYQLEPVIQLCKSIKSFGKNIWLYTGFVYEDIVSDPQLQKVLAYVDTIVDGPYISSLRDLSLRFRGSSNQRIINTVEENT